MELTEVGTGKKRKRAARPAATEEERAPDDGAHDDDNEEEEELVMGQSFRMAMEVLRGVKAAGSEGEPAAPEFGGEGEPDVEKQVEAWGLDAQLAKNLRKGLGISRFFPLQREAIGRFLKSDDNDLCISAPTGSGKTLVFALPVVAKLAKRVVRRLRALVVLPTRELALQCEKVFQALVVGLPLSVVASVGQSAFAQAERSVAHCDILVCTPGRLMDHLKLTQGFSLQHLAFLVIDEADRLLAQRYQGWLARVNEAAFRNAPGSVQVGDQDARIEAVTRRRLLGSSVASHRFDEQLLRRILCSATLTRNPQKLASLRLRRPIHVAFKTIAKTGRDKDTEVVHAQTDERRRFILPETLEHHVMVCPRDEKPLALFQLLERMKGQPTLIFTASVEATHRLALTLKSLLGSGVCELSSSQSQSQRSSVLKRLRKGEAHILVVSDVMSRGIDLDNLVNVINYDIPAYVKAYVHRVGRVARAGRPGFAYTLVRRNQENGFRYLLSKVRSEAPKRIPIDFVQFDKDRPRVNEALEEMKELVSQEAMRKRRG